MTFSEAILSSLSPGEEGGLSVILPLVPPWVTEFEDEGLVGDKDPHRFKRHTEGGSCQWPHSLMLSGKKEMNLIEEWDFAKIAGTQSKHHLGCQLEI